MKPEVELIISKLMEPFGPPIIDESFDSIVVSEETLKGGEKINEIRLSKNMKKLEIIIYPLINPRGGSEKLSSTYYREIDYKKFEKMKGKSFWKMNFFLFFPLFLTFFSTRYFK
jgi:phosphopantetheine adenylyltransferase